MKLLAQILFVVILLLLMLYVYLVYLNPIGTAMRSNTTDPSTSSSFGPSTSDTIKPTIRTLQTASTAKLPLSGSAPTENVKHTIPFNEIRQGCFKQDCIPAVDEPVFISPDAALDVLSPDTIGIAVSLSEDRFYPFPMLETKELVNDVLGDQAILVSYCPLCGTGIVFDRTVNGVPTEFGVSGMLWQSNLLMYNRNDDIEKRNLWSQVLGEAVVGERAGEKLTVIPSDIMRLADWAEAHPTGVVLNTGEIRDPYNGAYYDVAARFKPDFDPTESPLQPMEYVYGIEVDSASKAYPRDSLPVGTTFDTVSSTDVVITKDEIGRVSFVTASGDTINDIEGFWFSWVSAYPGTELWDNN